MFQLAQNCSYASVWCKLATQRQMNVFIICVTDNGLLSIISKDWFWQNNTFQLTTYWTIIPIGPGWSGKTCNLALGLEWECNPQPCQFQDNFCVYLLVQNSWKTWLRYKLLQIPCVRIYSSVSGSNDFDTTKIQRFYCHAHNKLQCRNGNENLMIQRCNICNKIQTKNSARSLYTSK